MERIVVDARGRSCPEPVILTKNALARKAAGYEILVDNRTALGNVSRFLTHAGKTVKVEEQGEDFRILAE